MGTKKDRDTSTDGDVAAAVATNVGDPGAITVASTEERAAVNQDGRTKPTGFETEERSDV